MKNIAIMILLLLSVLFLSECKKDNTTSNNSNNNNVNNVTGSTKVKSTFHRYISNGIVRTYSMDYSYDAQGRVSTIQEANQTTTYVYLPDTILEIVHVFTPNGIDTTTYLLNSAGLAISGTGKYRTVTCTYDANGYLTYKNDCNTYGGSICVEVNNTIANGNIIYTTGTYGTATYTMSTDIDTRDFGNTFFGKANKNLIQAESGATGTYNHSYNRDSNNRIIQDAIGSDVMTYTY